MSTFWNHYTWPELMFRVKYIDDILPMPLWEWMAQDFWTALVIWLLDIKIHFIDEKLIYHKIREWSLQRIFEKKPIKEQNEIRMKYFYFLQQRFPNKDLTYIVNYNYDRFIIWYNKWYSLIIIHLIMLFKYPKIFFLWLKSVLYSKFLFIKHIWSLYR